MLQDLVRKIALGVVAALLAGIGSGAVLVAITFAIYAALKPHVGPAAASALTALAAAFLTAAAALVLMRAIKSKPQPGRGRGEAHGPAVDPTILRELGPLALGVVADMAAGRRAKEERKAREARRRR